MTYLYQLTERCDQQLDTATTKLDGCFKVDNYFTRRARLRHFKKNLGRVYGRGHRTMLRLESLYWKSKKFSVAIDA
jgi:hypothetical protein